MDKRKSLPNISNCLALIIKDNQKNSTHFSTSLIIVSKFCEISERRTTQNKDDKRVGSDSQDSLIWQDITF